MTSKQKMKKFVAGLRKQGFRIHEGAWPKDEHNFDFCLTKAGSLFTISRAARERNIIICNDGPPYKHWAEPNCVCTHT